MARLPYIYRGFIAPVFTPFNYRNSTLNLSIIPKYAKYLVENGVNGVLVNGTTGEGVSMSVSERKQVAEAWANAVKITKQHLMIQVGGAPFPDVVELAKHAEGLKVDSILCLPELYFKPTDTKNLMNYLKNVGEAAPNTPLLYYHIPMLTNVNIHMGEFLNLIGDAIPSFVGIKFTSTNLEEGAQAVRANSNQFVVFLGTNLLISAGYSVGIDSFIPTSINMFPGDAIKISDASKQGDGLKATELQEKLSQAVIAISRHGNWVTTMKAAMALLNTIDLGPVRLPNEPISPKSIEIMKKELKSLGFHLNENTN
ncbi:N-acetylneuraminate lyase [Microplitis demolitor]|uniref:N-acetylneuraminate lyase n=1 Tax=Microplitis demolitor TaxID=69319 RepID=UPI0004CD0F96|nr:N-acetylneuraminate lyase [Microplitis demolitor]